MSNAALAAIAGVVLSVVLLALGVGAARRLAVQKREAEAALRLSERRVADLMAEQQRDRAGIQELNDQLGQRTRELVEVGQELDGFSYSVSHDLRAPLRPIDGFARLLDESLGQEFTGEGRRFLDRIRDAARQGGLLIDDLLLLSRVTRQGLQVQKTDLDAVLRNVVFDLREDLGGRQVDWRFSKLGSVNCDGRLVKQVFVNLVTNAVKFTRPRAPAVIEVGADQVGGAPAIFVRDNGVGFDMKYSEKLFGVFQRLHKPEDFEGTGVGLAIAHRIVRKHGGRIWAEAALDRGATFYFTLDAPPVPVTNGDA